MADSEMAGADRPYLDAALRAAAWIRSVSQPTGDGTRWPPDPEEPKRQCDDLYSGGAGIVLFLLELHHATARPEHLGEATVGAHHLLAAARSTADSLGAGLYTGIAGIGCALLAAHRVTREDRYREGVERCVEVLDRAARRSGAGVDWNDDSDLVTGAAGTALFLLEAQRGLNLPRAAELAAAAGHRLLDLAIEIPHGLKWAVSPSYPKLMPNFSHGTAGIAYTLAALHRHSGDTVFLDGALAGARYLCAVADTRDNGCLVFHHEPGGEHLFYRGWCHGPVGTSRLFFLLHRITRDRRWMDWALRAARSVRAAGVPQADTAGYWNNVGRCCGGAGAAELFLELHRLTGDPSHLELCREIAADLLARATPANGGLKWIQAEHRLHPERLSAQTGLMQGAAGIALTMLKLDALEQRRRPLITLPDEPWEN